MSRSMVMAFAALGLLLAISLLSAQNMGSGMMGSAASAPGGMREMHDKFLEQIFTHVESADTALAGNDVTKAKQELADAKGLIAQWRQMGHHATSMAAGKVSNAKCPIMLLPVGENTPPELTRQFKGLTIGFCCNSCLTQWDKMSDADRLSKLKAVGWNAPADGVQ